MEDLAKKLQNTFEWLAGEYSGIRSGQAAPALLDGVKVESYGALVPINQVGSVSIENARTLRVSLWDNSQVAALERAIIDANLGVSVVSDSSGLRVNFPELTSERRDQLLKLAKSKLEEARVRVKGTRDEMMKQLEASEKAGEIGKDELFTKKEAVQKKIEEANKQLEESYKQKEKEIEG